MNNVSEWILNSFSPNTPSLYPLKTSENQRSSDIFRRYGNGTLGKNGLIVKTQANRHNLSNTRLHTVYRSDAHFW